LEPGDDCYYLGEYTARAGYAFSATNDLIQNLKKPMDRKGRPEWRYKTWAINRSAEMLREVLPEKWLASVTFAPVPPSKARDHADYDDRLLRILERVGDCFWPEGRRRPRPFRRLALYAEITTSLTQPPQTPTSGL